MEPFGAEHALLREINDRMIRMDTKLTVVCGVDGRGGALADHETRLRAVEGANARDAGERDRTALAAMAAAAIAFAGMLGQGIWMLLHGGR